MIDHEPLPTSFSLLALPFRHAQSLDRDVCPPGWTPWMERLGRDDATRSQARERQLDDSWFFLPHVRDLLYGRETGAHLSNGGPPTTSVCRLSVDRPAGGTTLAFWLEPDRDRHDTWPAFRVTIDWADVALFPDDIGVLILKVHLGECPTEELARRFAAMREVHPPSSSVEARKLSGLRTDAAILDGIVADGLTLRHVVDRLLEPFAGPLVTDTRVVQAFGEIFRGLTFAVEPDVKATKLDASTAALVTATNAADADDAFQLSERELERLGRDATLQIWDGWRMTSSRDHTVVLVTHRSWFTDHVLPHNVESDYLWLWLLGFFQKVRLDEFAGELVWPTDASTKALDHADRTTVRFLTFMNRFWFAEVTAKEQGQRIFEFLQDRLGTAELFAAVNQETNQLRDHLQSADARRTAAQVSLVTFVGLPISMWIAFLGAVPDLTWLEAVALSLAGVLLISAIAACVPSIRALARGAVQPVRGLSERDAR